MDKELTYIVYEHITPSNKRYIGITSQENPNTRWANGKGYVGNKHFWNAIQKYGWENIEHNVLAYGLTQEEAYNMEIELITKYKTQDQNCGYNITSGGDRRNGEDNPFYGKHHTDETKKLIGQRYYPTGKDHACYGKSIPQNIIESLIDVRSKKIYVYDMNLNLINTYKNAVEASKALGIEPHGIYTCAEHRNGVKTNYNYVFLYEDEALSLDKESYFNGWYSGYVSPIIKFTKDMQYISEYVSINEASRESGLHPTNISNCANGKTKHCGGYIWKHKSDFSDEELKSIINNRVNIITKDMLFRTHSTKSKSVICLNTLEVFSSATQAGKNSSLKSAIHPRKNTSGIHPITLEPLHWMYLEEYENLSQNEKNDLITKFYTGSFLMSKICHHTDLTATQEQHIRTVI